MVPHAEPVRGSLHASPQAVQGRIWDWVPKMKSELPRFPRCHRRLQPPHSKPASHLPPKLTHRHTHPNCPLHLASEHRLCFNAGLVNKLFKRGRGGGAGGLGGLEGMGDASCTGPLLPSL